MAQTVSSPPRLRERDQGPAYRPGRGPTDWLGGWRTMFVACGLLLASFLALRVYQQFYAWYNEAGLNAASPGFKKYWFSLFVIEVLLAGAISVAWWGWLVITGRKLIDKPVSRNEEVRRIAVFWGLVAATSLTLYFMASFFPNQDGVWHQTLVRDTALTPSHIVMFFWAFPLGITMTVGTYLYGRYRLPAVYGPAKGFPWSFFFLIAASITEMMQVAMNEWGHSLWITEEIFAAPFHWPFVTYGWLASGIFALWAETAGRLLQLEEQEAEKAAVEASAA